MRSIIVIIMLMGMSSANAQTSSAVDRCGESTLDLTLRTASITRALGPAEKLVVILPKTDRLPRAVYGAEPVAAGERLALSASN